MYCHLTCEHCTCCVMNMNMYCTECVIVISLVSAVQGVSLSLYLCVLYMLCHHQWVYPVQCVIVILLDSTVHGILLSLSCTRCIIITSPIRMYVLYKVCHCQHTIESVHASCVIVTIPVSPYKVCRCHLTCECCTRCVIVTLLVSLYKLCHRHCTCVYGLSSSPLYYHLLHSLLLSLSPCSLLQDR